MLLLIKTASFLAGRAGLKRPDSMVVAGLPAAWMGGTSKGSPKKASRRIGMSRMRRRRRRDAAGKTSADENDPRVQGNPLVQVLDVVVDQPDASGRDEVADGLRRVGAVDDEAGLVQEQRACAKLTAGAASRGDQGVVLRVRVRRFPVGPFHLA